MAQEGVDLPYVLPHRTGPPAKDRSEPSETALYRHTDIQT